MKKISTIAAETAVFLSLFVPKAFAQTTFDINPTGIIKSGASKTIPQIVTFVVAIVSAVAILATLAYLVWGAIKWITSGGDKTKVEAARGQIVAAIIGFIIVVLSFVILNVVATLLGLGNVFSGITIPTL